MAKGSLPAKPGDSQERDGKGRFASSAMATETERKCGKCAEWKPFSEFYMYSPAERGPVNRCRDCIRVAVRARRVLNPSAVRDYDRGRNKLPHRKAISQAKYEASFAEHPERFSARAKVTHAVRQGRLQKVPCAFCGCDKQLVAHHHDYSKPLDVTWLCRPCHGRFHALERMATYRIV